MLKYHRISSFSGCMHALALKIRCDRKFDTTPMYRPTNMQASIGELYAARLLVQNHLFCLTLALYYK